MHYSFFEVMVAEKNTKINRNVRVAISYSFVVQFLISIIYYVPY